MATANHAQAVKSLNQGPGRRRYVFKTFSQRIDEIDIDVFKSLVPLQSEPSENSTFFRDCLVEWRELNTAEDFISFYEEMMPLVQTLPQIILHKEMILSALISRLQIQGRLSLEPILRLIAALSRDLLEDFPPFLQMIADSLASLLKSGADREPEIIEQIFTSWSYIMMYLQKYLVRDTVHVLRVTAELRYYPQEYVRELMAQAVSFLLRNAPVEQLKRGIKKVMLEVAKEPLRQTGVSALMWHVMRGTSLKLHSRAKLVLQLLLDNSMFDTGDKFPQGSESVLEVVTEILQRVCEELEPSELNLMWGCLYEEITGAASSGSLIHLRRLLSMMVSTVQVEYIRKLSDYQQLLQVVFELMQKFLLPSTETNEEDQFSGVVDRILELMLCILDGLHLADNASFIRSVAVQWAPVFKLRNTSLLIFVRQLLLKDSQVVRAFSNDIISALDGLIEKNKEEVVFLLFMLCEKLNIRGRNSSFQGVGSRDEVSRICSYFENAIVNWTGNINKFINGESAPIGLCESKLALVWGVISCYSCMKERQSSPALLLAVVDALDQHLVVESEDVASSAKKACQALIGAALSCCNELLTEIGFSSELVSKFLPLAKKYRSSPQVLSGVADFLVSVDRSQFQGGSSKSVFHPWLQVENIMDSLPLFAKNLCHPDKAIRLSTLRILCHYVSLNYEHSLEDRLTENKMKSDIQVFHYLLSIEETQLSVSTGRSVCLLVSRIQTDLNAGRVSDAYLPSVFYGLIGIFHNRFSEFWEPTMECLAFLIRNKFNVIGDIIIQYLEECQSDFLKQCQSHVLTSQNTVSPSKPTTDLLCRFRSFVSPQCDSTPSTTVLCLLIESLQKGADVKGLWTKDIVPLFLNFMGYNSGVASVVSFNPDLCKGKEWTRVLKEWLNLLKLNGRPKLLKGSEFLKEVLQYRLLDEIDAEIQMSALDCLLQWKDDYLLPYEEHLKNLINSITMREEMAIWSLSRESDLIKECQESDLIEECQESDLIEECQESKLKKERQKSDLIKKCHRDSLMPILIRVLVPKVRKPKILTTQKHTSVHHRKTVLGFLAQLDVNELRLFFGLLINPMLSLPQGVRGIEDLFGNSSENSVGFDSSSVLVYFTLDNIATLSWKQRSGFLHVIEDILLVFDKFHIEPFLDLLLGCVVRMLASCMSDLGSDGSSGLITRDNNEGAEDKIKNKPISKPSKELRSLCLKIISLVLNKYEEHQFDIEFWDMFFASVKPLTVCFKQGGASSEKPSSLFSCFLAMSRSFKLVSFLYKEQNLVPDIFSILTVQSASEAIISCVLEFVENLLNLGYDVDNEDSVIKKLLLPNVDTLICSLHSHFKFNNPARRKLIKHPGEREINIFKLLSKYVKDPSAAGKFVDIMLPLLTSGIQNSDACLEALQVIQSIVQVLAKESTPQILGALSDLLVSAGVDIRKSICDLLDSLAASDSSVLVLAKLIRELNATSAMEIGGLDLDVIINAYRKIDKDLFYTIGERQTVVILSHAVHDMSSSETILRESAFGLLVSFVEFSAVILDGQLMDCDQTYLPEACTGIITKFLLRHAGNAMSKDGSSRGVWIDLLRLMVLKLPKVQRLQSFRALCNKDAEQDFFYNIKHVQKHRVARALLRFKGFVSANELSLVTANRVFLPLFLDMLLNLPNGKGENVRSACIEALASISSKMEWPSYYAFLKRCFGEMEMKSDKKKVLLRLTCSVLDHFHFLEINSREEAGVSPMDVSNADATDTTVPTVLPARGASDVSEIQSCLRKDILPKIQKLLDSDSDNVNVNVSLLALKLLKLLPGDVMELQLPGIIQRISNFLKHRLESIRDEARLALSACLKELGLEYLKFILRVLNATLKRGYELHVLGYTLNSILSKYLVHPTSGKLDYCLEELLSVVENDILGDVSEQKEVEKIASKMKETGKCKSFETLKLVAQNITFKTHALKLLSPVTANMKKYLTPKLKSKLESMLKHIADGIECNPSVDQTDMFIFIYGLIEDTTKHTNGSPSDVNINKWSGKGAGGKAGTSSKLIDVGPEHCHLITGFAFGLLYNCLKRKNINKKDERLLSMLDPFVRMLTECLTSKFEGVIEKSLKCLALVVGLPLPSLESVAENMKTSVLLIAQSSTDSSGSLVQPCLSLLTVILRKTRITLSADQLHMIIQFPVFVDLEKNSSFGALSLLKAIVNRKLVVPEIYDLVTRVAELMVTNQVESFRRKCSQILLQFLLDYQLSEKRLQQHLDFLLSNLRYEHSAGRESVLEMIHAIVMKFPKVILDEHSRTIFLNLVMCLSNDHDKKVRLMTGAAIKLLIGRVSPHSKHSILEYSLSWYLSKNQQLWGAAAQVLGLLVEAMKKDFGKHVKEVLDKMKTIFHSAVSVLTDPELDHSNDARIPLWKEAYYSLVMLEKILNQFPDTCLSKDLEDTWETICEFLVHPHLWLRNVSNRLMAFYFASVSAASKESSEKSLGSFYLMRPSRLLLIALYLCYQLKGTIDNAGSALVIQNLAFTLCYVHSFSQTHNYWSTLDAHEEGRLLKAFQLLDSGKGKSVFTSLISLVTTESTQEDSEHRKSLLLSYLLRRMGKIALQTESAQMQVVFSILKSISPKIIGSDTFRDSDDSEGYAYQIMLPLYKVCEGYAGRVIPDDVKQIAQEALDSVKDALGANYSKVYMQVAKSLKGKREKRRQGEKVLAVVDPMRNAKRKMRIAAKSRANKKRKIMTMRIAKWMH